MKPSSTETPELPNLSGLSFVWVIVFLSLLGAQSLAVWVWGGRPSSALVMTAILAGVMTVVAFNVWRQVQVKLFNFGWYKRAFPAMVLQGGRIRCRHCSGTHITVRNLMNRTFGRAHVCNQCGETLYYSPEK